MIDLYFWQTPNGRKISIALEELELPHQIFPINIARGEQFKPEFLAISPNNRIPAIVDHKPADGGPPLPVFESGAILLYLADKTGKLMPADLRGRTAVLEWLMWQMGGIGPMFGQANHFAAYAPEKLPYAIDRYVNEVKRLIRVLNTRLADREFVAGSYSIADIASFPWVVSARDRLVKDFGEWPNVVRWLDTIAARPAVARGMAVRSDARTEVMDDEARKHLFGQR
ncbi:MAG: thiol:disulfide oxidoreductase [Deltaproteobacteria bacterium]|nr:MAG: thiol:disulfide oxidoreductase [Deltaproteobacteria bacterium]